MPAAPRRTTWPCQLFPGAIPLGLPRPLLCQAGARPPEPRERSPGPSDPYVRVGTVAVYVGGHEFDDDITWPEGSEIALRSEYPAMIEIRETSGDHQCQQEIAGKIFTALESAGRWRAVYIDDMQKVLDTYDPAQ